MSAWGEPVTTTPDDFDNCLLGFVRATREYCEVPTPEALRSVRDYGKKLLLLTRDRPDTPLTLTQADLFHVLGGR